MEKFETPPDSPPITVIDLDDQPMWSSTRTVALTPSSTIVQIPIPNNFHIKDNSQNKPKPKTIVSAGGSNINPDYAILMEKFEALATKIDSEFLIIRKELNEMRGGLRDDEGNPISDYYVKDDTPMYDPMEANYIQGHHSSYQNRNYPQSRPQSRMPHLSQYIELPKTLMEEMMREWMARQTKANERMKNQMVE
ncbi:hypothetical protein Tco_0634076 [Tanacetum coccineum]